MLCSLLPCWYRRPLLPNSDSKSLLCSPPPLQGVFGALVLLLASIFFSLGSILLIVIRPPGSFLVGALLFLVASIFLTL